MVAHDRLEFHTKLLLSGRWFDVFNALSQAHFPRPFLDTLVDRANEEEIGGKSCKMAGATHVTS